jgi:hypothetical protein
MAIHTAGPYNPNYMNYVEAIRKCSDFSIKLKCLKVELSLLSLRLQRSHGIGMSYSHDCTRMMGEKTDDSYS